MTKTLIIGKDSGSISTKITFLNNDGEFENFEIPTVISKAPEVALDYGGNFNSDDMAIEDYLHLRISSNSLDKDANNLTWYVGELAKNMPNKIQPAVEDGRTEEKFSDDNRSLFIIPILTGMAVAALKNGEKVVNVPLSFGIPSESYLKSEQSLKSRFYGKHLITFVDGIHAGETVEIIIDEKTAQVHAESVTTALALKFTIKKNELVPNKSFAGVKETDSYVVADLGAGTDDYAVFEGNQLDKTLTRNFAKDKSIGTNAFIDNIIEDVTNDTAFEALKSHIEAKGDLSLLPATLSSRETFMKKIVKPVMKDVLEGKIKKEKVKFMFSWANKKNVDITEHVLKHMKAYADAQLINLKETYMTASTDHMIVVGGGVLFGYLGGLDKLEDEGFIIADLENSQYFTSKSYAIAAYLKNLETQLETTNV